MHTLDANIFVRDLDYRDPAHADYQALIARLRANRAPIIVPAIMLPEVAAAVRSTWNDPIRGRLALQLLAEMPQLTLVPVDPAFAQFAAELATDYGLRGMDALYVATARAHGCTLVLLDRVVRERAAPVVRSRTPFEALAELEQSNPASSTT